MFTGFPKAGLAFLSGLKENNNREWFQERKDVYEAQVKAPMTALVEALNAGFARFAPEYITEPKKAMHRIYRDIRFSKNKDPYKSNASASFQAEAGYYVSVSPDKIEIGGGVYMPGAPELLAIRNQIAEEYEEWQALPLKGLIGESLTRPPKGFPAGHPAEVWLRRKQWYYFDTTLDSGVAVTPKLAKAVIKKFEAMYPVVRFLNRAVRRSQRSVQSL